MTEIEKKRGGRVIRRMTPMEAIAETVNDADSYYDGGALERMRERMNKQTEIIGRLVDILDENRTISADQLNSLLGHEFTVSGDSSHD